jgi:tRNA(fMet)-specific endonuclease VapC
LIHLDSTLVIDFLRETHKKQPGAATDFLGLLAPEEITVSVFAICELLAGVHLSQQPDKERVKVMRFCDDVRIVYPDERFAEAYGQLQSFLQRSGQLIGTMDLLIATLALVEGAPIVTRNVKDFQRIPDLQILSY